MLLKQIQYFMAIAECQHFTRAADRLFVSQSALSQQITKLENELGITLIDRISHPLRLTPAGRDFQVYAAKILDNISAMQLELQKYRSAEPDTIRIGMITGLGNIKIADILSSFNTKHKNISFSLTNKLSKELCRQLSEGTLDLALFAAPCDIDEYKFDVVSLEQDEFVCIASRNHPFAKKQALALKDAKTEQFIFPTQENVSHDLFLSECRKAGFTPKIASYCNEPGRRIDMVKTGLGISMIALSALKYYNTSDITTIHLLRPFYKNIVMARKKIPTDSSIEQKLWNHIKLHKDDK